MRLKEIDELSLIKHLTSNLQTDKDFLKHIGDDAAVIQFPKKQLLLFTSDMLIEGVHFNLRKISWPAIGHKAIARNISDIAAMGGLAKYATVSMGLPKNCKLKDIQAVYNGIKKTARKYGVIIAGGDVSSSEKLIVSIALIGIVKKKEATYRNTAKKGDLIFVTGELGGSIWGKHCSFSPRIKEARYLVEKFKPTSMIDLSDGLAQDLGHIIHQSQVGAQLKQKSISGSKEAVSFDDVLYGGEDFELLFTLNKEKAIELKKDWSRFFKLKLSQIGTIVDKDKGFYYLDEDEKKHKIEPKSKYRHFK
jgi:thiamine-monophosphate kinase